MKTAKSILLFLMLVTLSGCYTILDIEVEFPDRSQRLAPPWDAPIVNPPFTPGPEPIANPNPVIIIVYPAPPAYNPPSPQPVSPHRDTGVRRSDSESPQSPTGDAHRRPSTGRSGR